MPKKLMMNNVITSDNKPIMDGLVCWLESSSYDNSSIWQDKSGKGNHATMVGFDGVTCGNLNGTIKMKQGCQIQIPNDIGFTSLFTSFYRGTNDAQVDIIGTSPRTSRFCLRWNDFNPYYSNIDNIYSILNEKNPPIDNTMIGTFYKNLNLDNWTPLTLNFSTTNNVNTKLGYDTNSNSNSEYEIFLLYNRHLTKEESEYNYEYIKNKTGRLPNKIV